MKETIKIRRLAMGIAGCFLLIAADQITKYLAAFFLKGSADLILIPGVFQLHYLENTGVAFGFLKNRQWIPILFAAVIAAVFLAVYIKSPQKKRFFPFRLSLLGIIAGALGNMIDRIWHGYVIDFVYVSLIDFPVFNLADCYIVISIALLAVLFLFRYQEEDFSEIFLRKG